LSIKRFHDIGKSGWWWFTFLIPIYNIHVGIGLLTARGTVGPNQFGEDNLPPNIPDDIFNRFSQNMVARIIADIIVIGLPLLIITLTTISNIKNIESQNRPFQQVTDNITSQTVQPSESQEMLSTIQNNNPKLFKYTYKALPTDNFNSFYFNYPEGYDDGFNTAVGIHVTSLESVPHEFTISDSSGQLLSIDVSIVPLSGQLMNRVDKSNIIGLWEILKHRLV
jgi:hypothetical protein